MKRGFLLGSKPDAKKVEPEEASSSFDEDLFWKSVVTYCGNTVQGWHSGLFKVYSGLHPVHPDLKTSIEKSKVGDVAFYLMMNKCAEDYMNTTAVSFVRKDDPYVNKTFDGFKKLLNGKLPCCFYHHVCKLLVDVLNNLSKLAITGDDLQTYLLKIRTQIEIILKNNRDTFLKQIKNDLKNCKLGMDAAIKIGGSEPFITISQAIQTVPITETDIITDIINASVIHSVTKNDN
jgi:hypothetical protein